MKGKAERNKAEKYKRTLENDYYWQAGTANYDGVIFRANLTGALSSRFFSSSAPPRVNVGEDNIGC